MNGSTRPVRTIVAIVATACLALLAAACGGSNRSHVAQLGTTATGSGASSTSSTAASARGNRALAYSRCMRSNGVLDYPDPDSSGDTDKSKVTAARANAGSSRFDAALNACKHLLPASPPGPTPTQVQQVMNGMQNFARCVRSHGVPNWPGPSLDVGRPTFDIHSIDYKAPKVSAAIHACQHLMPGSTQPRMCSALLAQQMGDPAGDERCFGGG
jgi:hypothetical protein